MADLDDKFGDCLESYPQQSTNSLPMNLYNETALDVEFYEKGALKINQKSY